jgi:hypothetical protein
MAVYIDDYYKSGRTLKGMKMSHMIADTKEELLEMISKLKMNPSWIQKEGTYQEHFDVCLSNRVKAIKLGAIPIRMRDLVKKLKARKLLFNN